MQGSDRQDRHERFKELCALAHADALSIGERFELEEHLRICKPCREVYEAYALVSEEGMAFLAASANCRGKQGTGIIAILGKNSFPPFRISGRPGSCRSRRRSRVRVPQGCV